MAQTLLKTCLKPFTPSLLRSLSISSNPIRPFSSSSTSSADFTFEYIKNFDSIPKKEQEYLIYETFPISSSVIADINLELFRQLVSSDVIFTNNLILIREKTFNTIIGFSFTKIYEIFLGGQDKSFENKYMTTQYYNAVLPHFRGFGLGTVLTEVTEYLAQKDWGDCNQVSFNITLNPMYYELRSKYTPLIYPGPKELPSKGPEKLFRQIMDLVGLSPVSQDKPGIIRLKNLHIIGQEKEKYTKRYNESSDYMKYFIDQHLFEQGLIMCNLAVYNLVEGNTMGIAPGRYKNFIPLMHEINEYKPKFI
ncbi:hypothetical protein SteCoe_8508 [Stentor coeruleus]|uniref:Uncharacterized protein n=1 Tax=Stentor coeruleus TaxID=5963 RepID=A0A1R2CK91_9CILI|nr:hypothetical protein SteCoe_8508 [Stentor coeruleus]